MSGGSRCPYCISSLFGDNGSPGTMTLLCHTQYKKLSETPGKWPGVCRELSLQPRSGSHTCRTLVIHLTSLSISFSFGLTTAMMKLLGGMCVQCLGMYLGPGVTQQVQLQLQCLLLPGLMWSHLQQSHLLIWGHPGTSLSFQKF